MPIRVYDSNNSPESYAAEFEMIRESAAAYTYDRLTYPYPPAPPAAPAPPIAAPPIAAAGFAAYGIPVDPPRIARGIAAAHVGIAAGYVKWVAEGCPRAESAAAIPDLDTYLDAALGPTFEGCISGGKLIAFYRTDPGGIVTNLLNP